MDNLILLIFPFLLLIFTFYGAKISGKGEFSPFFLCSEQSKNIQVAACIAIMIHHVTQHITAYGSNFKGPVTIFNYIGFLFTGLFFFFSGYGLIYNVYCRKGYLDGFLIKRLSAVLIPFWGVNAVIVICEMLINRHEYGIIDFFLSISGIRLINSNGWFVIEILILYLFFYMLFKLVKNRDIALILLFIAVIMLIVFSFFRGHDPENRKIHWLCGEWWYNSTITFIYGGFFARFRNRIESIMKRQYKLLFGFSLVLLPFMTAVTVYATDHFGYYREGLPDGRSSALITLVIQMITCIVFTSVVLILNLKISLGNIGLKALGSFLLSLFLIHGYFVNSVLADIEVGDFTLYLLVLSSSIVCGFIISLPINIVVKYIRNIHDRRYGKKNDIFENNSNYNVRENDNEIRQIPYKKISASKSKLKIIMAVLICSFLTIVIFIVVNITILSKEYDEELISIRSAEVGDIVFFGHYDITGKHFGKERMTWIVVKRDAEKACLLSEYGIAGNWYNQKHTQINWMESDLRSFLHSKKFTGIFSAKEFATLVQKDGDIISLLSANEALNIFETEAERQLAITDVAIHDGVNINTPSKANNWDMKGYRSSWWWLKGDNEKKSITAPIVTEDGVVLIDEKVVNKPGGAIRPVIWVSLY